MAKEKIRFLDSKEAEFWKSVVVAVAGSSNATRTHNMYSWADDAVIFFRERNIQDKPITEAGEKLK